jgi:YidC/Oxa1 family membrane protein insertase
MHAPGHPAAPVPPVASAAPQPDFGWLSIIASPLYLALRFLYNHCIANWGWAIILLTVAFNLVLIGPRLIAVKSSLKMMRVQPRLQEIKKQYAGLKLTDPRRAQMNAAMMDLYKSEGVSMYGGCLPMLLQLPLLFAYMRVLQHAPELHHAGWLWLPDLASPDPLHILPILIVATGALTQWITPMPAADPTQRRIFASVMPLVMGFTLWHYASGLSLYWATGNLFSLAFQFVVNRSALGKQYRP